MQPVERRVALLSVTMMLVVGLLIALVVANVLRDPVVLTPGPCVVLGPATHPELVGPHLVIDCDGVQFGVRAVVP